MRTKERLAVYGGVGLLSALAVTGVILLAAREPAVPGQWLVGKPADRTEQMERHFRGLDVAMVEIAYRYDQLHRAGAESNWPYAQYQIEKIELALSLAVERRPKREASARQFLDETVPFMKQAIRQASMSHDRDAYQAALQRLRSDCIMCHVKEKVPYMPVEVGTTADGFRRPDPE